MRVSVTNTFSIRQFYGENKNLVIKTNRADKSASQLTYADTMALKKAARKLADFNFSDSTDSELEEKLKAFVDTYNNTLESGDQSALGNSTVKSTLKSIRSLTEGFSYDLENLGFSIDQKGYLSLSSSSVKNISHDKFSNLFGNESEYMTKLSKFARRMANHIDLRV